MIPTDVWTDLLHNAFDTAHDLFGAAEPWVLAGFWTVAVVVLTWQVARGTVKGGAR